jgi:hypothetical protein
MSPTSEIAYVLNRPGDIVLIGMLVYSFAIGVAVGVAPPTAAAKVAT